MITRLIRIPSARFVTRLGAMMVGSTGRKKENKAPKMLKLPIANSQKLYSLMVLRLLRRDPWTDIEDFKIILNFDPAII
jgi:hypothetical protein